MIEGVRVNPLRIIQDERGRIMHMLKRDDSHFEEFGEIYFSMVYPGVVKGWHLHRRITLNYAVPIGNVKLVLYDDRQGSETRGRLMELFIGEFNYVLVTISPGIWNGFKGIGEKAALVANAASMPHDPAEIIRMEPFSKQIPYDWSLKHQ